MNWKDLGEQNPATPSATVNTPEDRQLARAYVARVAPDLLEMLGLGGAS